jgi:hypothetical protein
MFYSLGVIPRVERTQFFGGFPAPRFDGERLLKSVRICEEHQATRGVAKGDQIGERNRLGSFGGSSPWRNVFAEDDLDTDGQAGFIHRSTSRRIRQRVDRFPRFQSRVLINNGIHYP